MSKSSRVKTTASAKPKRVKGAVSLKIAGSRVGTKFRDMRWQSPDGTVWASRFEYDVFSTLMSKGYNVERTTESDSLAYTAAVRNGECTKCASREVVTRRHYTPDILVHPKPDGGGKTGSYYIEAKGYLRADRRSLLRSFRKARPDVDFRLIIQKDYRVGKRLLSDWVKSFLKIPVHVWNGKIPEDW